MKKYAIIGLVLAALVFASCGKGGSVEVTNKAEIYTLITVLKGAAIVGAEQRAEAGETVTFPIDEDGNYIVSAVFKYPEEGPFAGEFDTKHITVSGGDTVRVTVNNK
jgi:hypothetical protein